MNEISKVVGAAFVFNEAFSGRPFLFFDKAKIVYVESGALELGVGEQRRIVFAGMAVYIPAMTRGFKKKKGPEVSGWLLNLPPELTDFMPREVFSLKYSDLAYWLSKKIISWTFSPETAAAYERLILTFCDELKCLGKSPYHLPRFPRDKQLRMVAKFLIENIQDMNTLDYWAKVAAKSRRLFTEAWKSETGLSFAVWRQRVKFLAALRMLEENKSVTEVALSLGYKNVSTFNVVFRKEFGDSPLNYMLTKKQGR